MVASAILNDYRFYQAKSAEDALTVTNAVEAIRQEYQDYSFVAKPMPKDDCAKILSQTTLSIKKFANSYYKSSAYLEPSEIDHIKDSLKNYASDDERVTAFKREIIDDLSNFQKQIKEKYVAQIADYRKKQQLCEKQIRVYEFEKNKLIMDRLSKIAWPYDAKTKEYDQKIAALESQAQHYAQRALSAQQMRPAANEKDILLYQMQLKEKYSK